MSSSLFGQFLLSEGLLTQSELKEAVRELRSRNQSLGELAVAQHMLSARQVAELNREQRTTDLMLGELAVRRGMLNEEEIERLVILQKATQVSLGQLLVERNQISETRVNQLERKYTEQQKLTRRLCEREITELPQAENVQLCLNELVKGLQRICRQVVSINEVQREGMLSQSLPYIVLQKVSGPRSFHFGLAVPAEQVQRISNSLSGEPENDNFVPVSAMERFSDIVVKNACAKLPSSSVPYAVDRPKAFFVGEQMPAYKDMVGVHMLTEDGRLDAVFFGT